MTIDRNGNLYLTGKGVTVYNPAGYKNRGDPCTGELDSKSLFFREKQRRAFYHSI